MSKMYNAVPATEKAEAESISKIQNELNDLQEKVLKQNQINRDLLKLHIENIRTQIQNFNNPYANRHNVYASKKPVAQLVEVEA